MNYTIINNNPQNFKVLFTINGKEQYAQLREKLVVVSSTVTLTLNARGDVICSSNDSTDSEFARALLMAYHSNGYRMTVPIFESLANPNPKKKRPKAI